MAKKKTKRKKPEPLVSLGQDYSMEILFSDRLQKEPETLRRLAHRAVDLVADAGHYRWLSQSVAFDLAHVADDVVVKHLTELIHDVRAEGKRAPSAIP